VEIGETTGFQMRELLIVGEDLRQIMGLAASVGTHFQPITVIHADDPVTRAVGESRNVQRLMLICLPRNVEVRPVPFKATYVLGPGDTRDQLTGAGARCLDPDEAPARILAALAPRRRRPAGSGASRRFWSAGRIAWTARKRGARN
jgi:hypothetical protein